MKWNISSSYILCIFCIILSETILFNFTCILPFRTADNQEDPVEETEEEEFLSDTGDEDSDCEGIEIDKPKGIFCFLNLHKTQCSSFSAL